MFLPINLRRFSNYVPPKPPSMRKVVREKDKYVRGVYEMNQIGVNALLKNISKVELVNSNKQDDQKKKKDNKWYTVYQLPIRDIKSFRSRQVIKYWMQVPPLLLFAKFAYGMSVLPSSISLAVFLLIRYYSQFRYPQIKSFESYYVEKLEINDELQKVQLTWALPKQPKMFTIPIERFKQIHFLKHECNKSLSDDLLPFSVFEAGFDDNKFETLYRTIFFHVHSQEQNKLINALSNDQEVVNGLSKQEKQMKIKLDNIIFDNTKKGSSEGVKIESDQIWSLDIKDYIKHNKLTIEKEFLQDNNAESSLTDKEAEMQIELLAAILNGYQIKGRLNQ